MTDPTAPAEATGGPARPGARGGPSTLPTAKVENWPGTF